MNRPTFFEGISVALMISIVVAAGSFVIITVFAGSGMLKLLMALVSAAYIGYLMIRSRERLGRLTVFSIWFIATLLSAIFIPSLLIYGLLQLGMIWLVRSLYYYNSILAALMDLGLTTLSTVVGLWAWFNTHSLFLAVWCFFLMQALFVLIPRQWKSATVKSDTTSVSDDRFEQAYLAAEQAVRQSIHNSSKS